MRRGTLVRSNESHRELNVTSDMVGKIESIEGTDVAVVYPGRRGSIVFQESELRRVCDRKDRLAYSKACKAGDQTSR